MPGCSERLHSISDRTEGESIKANEYKGYITLLYNSSYKFGVALITTNLSNLAYQGYVSI